jgi:hypothetical protein
MFPVAPATAIRIDLSLSRVLPPDIISDLKDPQYLG